jgi:hypothetical protein
MGAERTYNEPSDYDQLAEDDSTEELEPTKEVDEAMTMLEPPHIFVEVMPEAAKRIKDLSPELKALDVEVDLKTLMRQGEEIKLYVPQYPGAIQTYEIKTNHNTTIGYFQVEMDGSISFAPYNSTEWFTLKPGQCYEIGLDKDFSKNLRTNPQKELISGKHFVIGRDHIVQTNSSHVNFYIGNTGSNKTYTQKR